jgi:predicted ABC-type ATPase
MNEKELQPQFLIVLGGAGSGKNHFIEHTYPYQAYKLIDVDQIKKDVALSTAISSIKPMLEKAFKQGKNIAHPTTGSNLKGLQNKILLAKQFNYTITVVLIDTEPHNAINQVRNRVRSGGHNVEIANIISSNKKAQENFNLVKDTVDYTKIIKNTINEAAPVEAPKGQIIYQINTPLNFTHNELLSILELIKSETQVSSAGLMDRIHRAKLIAVARDANMAGKIVAVSIIKVPDANYKSKLFKNAQVPELDKQYPFEMGYKVVLPEYRNNNLGAILSQKLLQLVSKNEIFATIRESNTIALVSIFKLGFTPIGKPFMGASGNRILLLVVKNSTTAKKTTVNNSTLNEGTLLYVDNKLQERYLTSLRDMLDAT